MSAPPSIEGLWQPLKAELSGETAPDMLLARMTLTLREGRYLVHFGGEVSDRGTFTLSPGEPHAEINLHGEAGANAGKKIPAIFQLVGDRLRICFGLDGLRPDTFTTASETRFYLVTYRRTQA
jgi:uncharacterized protein (TIGR03067 family)